MNETNTYYGHERPEMLAFVPRTARRVLDVGCGAGAFSSRLKRERAVEVWGVEMNTAAAKCASQHLDKVLCGEFNETLDLDSTSFDCIIFNDVLEHMVSPEKALQLARRLLAPAGVVVASIPNARHLSVVWELAVSGDWRYRSAGILDQTHLRFFTKTSLLRMFQQNGYEVSRCEGINQAVGRKFFLLNLLCLNRLEGMRHMQYAIVASPIP